MCKTNPSIAHIELATHGRSIQIASMDRYHPGQPQLQPVVVSMVGLAPKERSWGEFLINRHEGSESAAELAIG
jgi:hypothetical protein